MNLIYLPRICVAIVLGGFFLPWVTVDFMGVKTTISGVEWATTKSPNGSLHRYGLFIAPLLAIIAAVIHTKRNYNFLSIASAVVLLLIGPTSLEEGAAELGVSRGIGLWVSLLGLVGMLVAADFLPEDPKVKGEGKENKIKGKNKNKRRRKNKNS